MVSATMVSNNESHIDGSLITHSLFFNIFLLNHLLLDEEDAGTPDDGSVTVIDIVDTHRLKEITLDKKAWTALIRDYLKKLKAKLEEQGKVERAKAFQKGATELVKLILSKFDEIQIFVGDSDSNSLEAGMAYCY